MIRVMGIAVLGLVRLSPNVGPLTSTVEAG
jgi:hypothetical protein